MNSIVRLILYIHRPPTIKSVGGVFCPHGHCSGVSTLHIDIADTKVLYPLFSKNTNYYLYFEIRICVYWANSIARTMNCGWLGCYCTSHRIQTVIVPRTTQW